MADRTNKDERDKFDHSDHPTDRARPDDLKAPSGGKAEGGRGHEDSRSGVPQQEPVTAPDSRRSPNT